MRKIIFVSILSLIFSAFLFLPAFADQKAELNSSVSENQGSRAERGVLIYFWGDGCPHCAKESKFLEGIAKKYPELEIKKYEVWYNQANQKTFQELAKKYNIERLAVPLTIINGKSFLGYQSDDTTGKMIEEEIIKATEEINPSTRLRAGETKHIGPVKVNIPFLGSRDLSAMSLPLLTVVIAGLDGLNPCAMWVLLFLLVLLIGSRSRKRMWLIAGTFILASGIVYFLVLAAWLNLFLAVSYIGFIRTAIGIFAVGFGLWQIKNFIQYKPGTCKITDGKAGWQEKLKNGLKNRAEKLVFSPLTFGIVIGVVVLAVGVNLVEFFCSAGLPAIYTNILSLNQLSSVSYYLYLLLYTFIFMLDDLIVFSIAIITLSKFTFTEKYNYWATLIGGILILVLGLLLTFRPGLLMFA